MLFKVVRLRQTQEVRYLTIAIDRDVPVIYGLDKYNSFKIGFVTEGVIDSFFFRNSLATAGGDIAGKLNNLKKINDDLFTTMRTTKTRNDPKNGKGDQGRVQHIMWPDNFEYKDINDAVIGGMKPQEIEDLILEHSFSGIAAQFELTRWRRV